MLSCIFLKLSAASAMCRYSLSWAGMYNPSDFVRLCTQSLLSEGFHSYSTRMSFHDFTKYILVNLAFQEQRMWAK